MRNPEHLLPQRPDQPVILVADDDVMVVNIVRIALEKAGCFVLTAQNGAEALELSHKFPGSIHALVSDIKMPRMDGLELRERILSERPATKVLLMSGEFEGPTTGPFLPKPFTIGVLQKRVRELLAA